MTSVFYQDEKVTLYQDDVLSWALDYKKQIDAGKALPFAAIVSDPPYGLSEPPPIEKVLQSWLAGETYEHKKGGMMGKAWDSLPPSPQYWKALYDICFPGAYMFLFSGTRTADLMGIAARLGGWEPFDRVASFGWTFGSGFPKSHSISKALDKEAGVEREVVRPKTYEMTDGGGYSGNLNTSKPRSESCEITAPATPLAQQFADYGTAAKPAHEPILLFRKPREGRTFAQCAREFGSGGLNVGGTRVAATDFEPKERVGAAKIMEDRPWQDKQKEEGRPRIIEGHSGGRWPPNVSFSHSAHTHRCPTCNGDGCPDCFDEGAVGGCRRVGVRRVRGTAPMGKPSIGSFIAKSTVGFSTGQKRTYQERTDPDGYEQVADWACVENCAVRLLDEMGPHTRSTQSNRGNLIDMRGDNYNRARGKRIANSDTVRGHNDEGGPSRFFPAHDWSLETAETLADETPFFYCAKAGRRERDAGLDGFAEQGNAQRYGSIRQNRGAGYEEGSRARNTHECVKPLTLTRWLATLCRPPIALKPRICIPYAGSGSEAIGAILAGWTEIHAIERELEYCEIAAARIAWWSKWSKLTNSTDPATIRKLGQAADAKVAQRGDERQTSMFDLMK